MKRPDDEIMELNTGDVIPLFDDELEILEDDRKARQGMPVLAPVSEIVLPARTANKRPVSASTSAAAPRRPRKEALPQPEAMETLVTTSLAAREGQVANAGFSEAFLYVDKGPGAGQLVPVLQGDLAVGRASECGLQLNHPSVSRKHAVLSRRGEQYFLVDAGSQNGTYVNWAKIRGEVEVFPGDQISIGSAVVILRGGLYTSAMRRGAASATATGVVEAPPPRKWLLGVGVFGAAVGIGVAAVVLLSNRGAPAKVEKPEVAPAVVAETKPVEAEPVREAAKPIEAPKAAAAEPKIVNEVEAVKAEPESEPEEPARHEREHAKKSKHAEKAERKIAMAESASAGAEAPPAVLKVYETGNVEGAIAAAEQAGAGKLAAKIKQFNAAYTAGKDALASKDGGAAVSNFTKALKLDESIDSGWGKLNGEIRGQLAGLYVLAGNQALNRGNTETAVKAFKAAQSYQPANAEARAKLRELQGSAGKKAAPAANPRAAADAAFDG